MAPTTEDVLERLRRPLPVRVVTGPTLVANAAKAATAMDRRRKKGKGGTTRDDVEQGRRKPGLAPLASADRGELVLTPWALLGALARATTLARQARGRGLAEQWQVLKYCRALDADGRGRLALTTSGRIPELWYRHMQARELGRAFGLAVAERAVRNAFPDRLVSVVEADAVLLAGFARSGKQSGNRPTLGKRPRPDHFIEAWRPGEPSVLFAVTVNGSHQIATSRTSAADRTAFGQLARGAERAEHFQLGRWNNTPCLLMSTELLATGGITVNALRASGAGLLPVRPDAGPGSADGEVRRRNPPYSGSVRVPASGDRSARVQDGFFIPRADAAWFGRVVARTAAAGQLAFAGAGKEIAPYLTDDQGRRLYEDEPFAGSASVRDARHTFGPAGFVGTDQVFRLLGNRVEAFSGVAEDLFDLLKVGELEKYRRQAYARRSDWPTGTTADRWDVVSFADDGTVLALREVAKDEE
ncbi:hypothetical protein [Kitasatospora sp. NPDC101183]|uniref:hypothetical protein n=1 Tax=Kitasatospora sp. NPDC101183 TaxID=3364100 RepID=UPI003813E322